MQTRTLGILTRALNKSFFAIHIDVVFNCCSSKWLLTERAFDLEVIDNIADDLGGSVVESGITIYSSSIDGTNSAVSQGLADAGITEGVITHSRNGVEEGVFANRAVEVFINFINVVEGLVEFDG
jgi:hypothetical protein